MPKDLLARRNDEERPTNQKKAMIRTSEAHRVRCCIFLVIIALVATASALAQAPSGALPGVIQRRFEPPPPTPEVQPAPRVPEGAPRDAPPGSADIRFELTGVVLDGVTVYSESDLMPFWQDLLGEEVSLADIYDVAAEITAKYRNDGYILSRAIVPAQEIEAGIARIQVIEGYVDQVIIEGELDGPEFQVQAKADRIQQSRPLQVSVLERNLLLMNELPGLSVEAILQPSETVTGAADLILTTRHKTFSGDLQLDNRGTEFTGPVELLGTARASSLLGWYEQTALGGVITPIEPEELQLISLDHTELLGTNGTTGSLFGSFVQTEPSGGGLSRFDVEGQAISASATVAHPVILRRSERLDARFTFSFLNSQTDFLQIIENANGTEDTFHREIEDRIRALRLGASYSFADEHGGINLVAAEASQGLDILDATSKDTNTSRDGGHADFTKFSANASRLQTLSSEWSLFGAVKGQYALDQLLASEQFDYGGQAFGRGFDPFEFNGDSGFAVLGEVRYDRFVGARYLQSYQGYASADYGIIWNKDTDSTRPEFAEVEPGRDELNPFRADNIKSSEDAASLALGVRFVVTPNVSGSFEVALPLIRTPEAESNRAPRPFFRLTAAF